VSAPGWRSPLLPGVREEALARRLADEVAIAEGLLLTLTVAPGEYWRLASERADRDEACRAVFVGAWLVGDAGDPDPFAAARAAQTGVRAAVRRGALAAEPGAEQADISFERFAQRGGGPHAALIGDPAWRAARRFERVAERLSLPGLSRALRFRVLVLLGRLGVIEARAPALLLADANRWDRTLAGAVRVFANDEPAELERRAGLLADAAQLPFDVLDLALWNLADAPRATLGEAPGEAVGPARERTLAALALRP
jgi:hypothetical protein